MVRKKQGIEIKERMRVEDLLQKGWSRKNFMKNTCCHKVGRTEACLNPAHGTGEGEPRLDTQKLQLKTM